MPTIDTNSGPEPFQRHVHTRSFIALGCHLLNIEKREQINGEAWNAAKVQSKTLFLSKKIAYITFLNQTKIWIKRTPNIKGTLLTAQEREG